MAEAKTVFITDGNKGIGLHITQLFLEKGDTVIVAARDFTDFSEAHGPRVRTIAFDVTRIDDIPDLVARVGPVDVLVNNAGGAQGLTPEAYTSKARNDILNLNAAAPVAFITAFLPGFLAQGAGRVVNVASQAGVFGHYDIWYGATKAALINATKSFASLYGKRGLIVNAVSPGPVEGDLIAAAPKQERFEKVKARTILKRYALPREVAEVVYWLAKESPVYLNGENYLINNGVTSLDA
ncbi:MAG: SDR family oxidoreductase [Azoarcus sp.]|jgi:3-oxoacyl-[acyl-carrier protein] reductase|nr:SDR family oxidoreductase [Azoarcus sp.]